MFTPPEPDCAAPASTDPADEPQSCPCTDVATCTMIGFITAMFNNCAIKLRKTLLRDDSDSLPVSKKSSHMLWVDD